MRRARDYLFVRHEPCWSEPLSTKYPSLHNRKERGKVAGVSQPIRAIEHALLTGTMRLKGGVASCKARLPLPIADSAHRAWLDGDMHTPGYGIRGGRSPSLQIKSICYQFLMNFSCRPNVAAHDSSWSPKRLYDTMISCYRKIRFVSYFDFPRHFTSA